MDLSRFLKAKSIAVFGGVEAEEVIRQCEKMGFSGEIWPVHPKREHLAGRICYRDLEDLPRAPDAAYIAVNRHVTVDLVGKLSAMGCGGAVCYATGFAEAGPEGQKLAEELLQASGDMMIFGPNCYGIINYIDGLMLWPDQQGGRRVEAGVAIITQSSNVAFNFTLQNRGLPLAHVQSLGTRLKYDLPEAIRAFADDDAVTAIGLHIEGIADIRAFEKAVSYARSKKKPIVAIKIGTSEKAQKIALSHTASLTGQDDLISALFRRIGVARLYSMDSFLEALKILHVHGPLAGHRISAMAPSGGDCSLMADTALANGLIMPDVKEEIVEALKPTLHEAVDVANPFDYQLYDWRDEERLFAQFKSFLASGFDFNISLLDFPRLDRCSDKDWQPAKQAFIRAAKDCGTPSAIMAALPENMPETLAEELMDAGVIPLCGLEAGLQGIKAAADIGAVWGKPEAAKLLPSMPPIDPAKVQSLDEYKSKSQLSAYGLPIPKSKLVNNLQEALMVAEDIGYPVIAKVVGVDHKSDIGGVFLNLLSDQDLKTAVEALSKLSDQFLIEEMVKDVIAELIVGINHDAQFGPYLVIGAGGVMVEILKDSVTLPLPVSENQVSEALNSLKTAPLFHGFRGKAKADLEAATTVILAIANYASNPEARVFELDVNPLMLLAEGKGVMAVDALVRKEI